MKQFIFCLLSKVTFHDLNNKQAEQQKFVIQQPDSSFFQIQMNKQTKPNTKHTKKKECYLKINTQKTYLWNKSVKSPSNFC